MVNRTAKRQGHKVLYVPPSITVRELAELMEISPIDLIKELMSNGIMANINQVLDFDTIAIVGEDLGFDIREEREVPEEEEEEKIPQPTMPQRLRLQELIEEEDESKLVPRPPVVTVMGHVDHGKTSLLDAIRETNVVAGEVGGITQHIGAYQVETEGRKITFIDTPGHEAFTAMRARGAQATDIAVLVIAADDGVMPQTLEALDHARAAGVPLVVALNKVDRATANPERVKQQLAELDLVPDDWGGDTLCVSVSATQRTGLDDLLEAILLVAEEEDLRANPDRLAVGTVIEGGMDPTRGPIATVLVQAGTLRLGDSVVVDDIFGRVKALFDHNGRRLESVPPGMPAVILGLQDVPMAGDILEEAPDERAARDLAQERAQAKEGASHRTARPMTLEDVFARLQAKDTKELNLVLKADVQGSLEPIRNSLEQLSTEDVRVNILRQGTGNVSESDVMLARASDGIVIGFQVQADVAARAMAETEAVGIRLYQVIYELVEDVEKALKGLLEPEYEDVLIGQAEIRAVFTIPRRGKVAGVYVTEGMVTRNALARVRRNGQQLYEGRVASLKRFTEDVREVQAGFECGVGLENYEGFQEGDLIEFYQHRQRGAV